MGVQKTVRRLVQPEWGGASRIVGSEVGEVIEASAHRPRRSHSEDCKGDGRPWRAGN